jgi:NDP-sugar pyrophosphorylase family protein
VEYLKANGNFGMRIEVSREEVLLDTGGGLKKAAWFFVEDSSRSEEPFIVHNVDVVSTIDLGRMVQLHSENQALATLAVQERNASRYLLFDERLQLCGRRADGEETEVVRFSSTRSSQPMQELAFCGIHIISPRLFAMTNEEGAFSIISSYLRLAERGEIIQAFRADKYYWRDLGTPENIAQAAKDLQHKVITQ